VTHAVRRSTWSGLVAMAVLALALSAASHGASAQETKARPLPPGVAACDFGALANDYTREGLNIRAEPNPTSAILGRLPVIENIHREKIAADFHVIGVRNGWFLIEGASYADDDLPPKIPSVYSGRGWVSGKLLTTQLHYFALKAAPEENAATVGSAGAEHPTAILDCKGDWLRVEAPLLTADDTPKPKPPSGNPPGIVRGWTHWVCVNQRTTCGG